MPASHEVVPNKPLNGLETIEIICQEVRSMLRRDGMFSEHMAFGRMGIEIVVKLHLDNLVMPTYTSLMRSRTTAGTILESAPLPNASEDAVVVGLKRELSVDSPNLERIRRDMPVTVMGLDPKTGQSVEQQIKYDSKHEDLPATPEPVDTDISGQVESGWELPSTRKGRTKARKQTE